MTQSDIRQNILADVQAVFSERVRVAMAVKQATYRDVADAVGTSPMAVSKWANGESFPSSGHLMEFCKFTDCSMEWVMHPTRVDLKSTDHPLEQMKTYIDDLKTAAYRIENAADAITN